jgi:uncharacterized membrane protein
VSAIATVARYTTPQKERETLLRHAEMIKRDSQQAIAEESDNEIDRYSAEKEVSCAHG